LAQAKPLAKKLRECAWQIPGNGKNSIRPAENSKTINVKNNTNFA